MVLRSGNTPDLFCALVVSVLLIFAHARVYVWVCEYRIEVFLMRTCARTIVFFIYFKLV